MKKTVACVVARTVSTRLPLKVLRAVDDEHRLIDYIIRRLQLVKSIDEIYICTSRENVDDILEDVAASNGVNIYRGSPESVIERLISVGDLESAHNLIRITGDNVFTSYEYLDQQIHIHAEQDLDYSRIIDVPIGSTAEIMKLSAVKKCFRLIDPAVSEYLMFYMFNPDTFTCGVFNVSDLADYSGYTLTVDTPADLARTKEILRYSGSNLKLTLREIVDIVTKQRVAHCLYPANGIVRMPYGQEILYKDFLLDIKTRIAESRHFTILEK